MKDKTLLEIESNWLSGSPCLEVWYDGLYICHFSVELQPRFGKNFAWEVFFDHDNIFSCFSATDKMIMYDFSTTDGECEIDDILYNVLIDHIIFDEDVPQSLSNLKSKIDKGYDIECNRCMNKNDYLLFNKLWVEHYQEEL